MSILLLLAGSVQHKIASVIDAVVSMSASIYSGTDRVASLIASVIGVVPLATVNTNDRIACTIEVVTDARFRLPSRGYGSQVVSGAARSGSGGSVTSGGGR